MRRATTPSIRVVSDLVHEAVHNVTVSGKDLEDVVIAAVVAHLGIDPNAAGVKVKCYLSCCSGASGIVHSAEVTIIEDHRPRAGVVNAAAC